MRTPVDSDIVWFTRVSGSNPDDDDTSGLVLLIPKGSAQIIRESIEFVRSHISVQQVVVSLTQKWSKERWSMLLDGVVENEEGYLGTMARVYAEPDGQVSFEVVYGTEYHPEVVERRSHSSGCEEFPLNGEGGIFISDEFRERLTEDPEIAREIRRKVGDELFGKILAEIGSEVEI